MDFNYDNSINSNNNIPENNTEVKNKFRNFERSVFDAVFRGYDEEKEKADLNKDGTISVNEIKNYINNYVKVGNDKALYILKLIAGAMGLVFKDHGESDEKTAEAIYKLKRDTLNEFKNFELLDFNKDNVVGADELEYGNTIYSADVTKKMNNTRGIIDGQIVSYQGNKGDCWLLSTLDAISQKNPNLLKDIIKQDENGNVTVTIKGVFDEPFVFNITKEELQNARNKAVAYHRMSADDLNRVEDDTIYSTDIDSIAIEMAIEAYDKYEKAQLLSPIVKYIENSTFNVEKPKMMGEVSIEDIAEMAEEEIEMLLEQGKISLDREMYIIKQFLVSNIDGKGEPVDDGSAKYYKDLAQFILDSELSTDVLYKEDLFDPNSELLEEFLSITNPNDGFEKLDIDILGKRSRLSTSDGSVPTSLLRTLFGDDVSISYVNASADNYKDQVKDLVKNFDKNSNEIYMLAFQKKCTSIEGNNVYARHEYYINDIKEIKGKTYIEIVDSHDSSKTNTIQLNTLLENFFTITSAILPK